ncbi:hypothetical protein CR513_30098, partial [Mucuna pruriens]
MKGSWASWKYSESYMDVPGGSSSGVDRTKGMDGVNTRRNSSFKKLTEEEYEDKRRRRVCFRCDEPFAPSHMCRNKHLHVLMLGEGVEVIENDMWGSKAEENPKENTMMLHMNIVVGATSRKSLKLWGTILDKKETREYALDVGDGHRIVYKGVRRDVELKLPSLDVKQDFYLFDLGGVDVVLGYAWLEELGDIKANFKEHVMKMTMKGEEVELRGDPTLSSTMTSIKAMIKERE